MDLAHLITRQRDVAKDHISIASEVLNNFVPAWRLLHSSASALRGDPADEHSLAGIHIVLHKRVGVLGCELCGSLPMAVGVYACVREGSRRQHTGWDAEHRHRCGM